MSLKLIAESYVLLLKGDKNDEIFCLMNGISVLITFEAQVEFFVDLHSVDEKFIFVNGIRIMRTNYNLRFLDIFF